MKTPLLAILVMAAAILLSACGEMIPAPTSTPVFVPASTATPDLSSGSKPIPADPIQLTPASTQISDYPIAVQKAIKSLSSKLGIGVDQIKVIGYENVQWPNGCLGIQQPGVMCTMVIVDGYRVILEANGARYEYHTNINGGAVELNPNAGPLPRISGGKNIPGLNDSVLTWRTSGGIAGLCEDLSISGEGKASAYSCIGGASILLGEANLSTSELDQLNRWMNQYKNFEVTTQDPAVADGMSTRLVFIGKGTLYPQESDKQAIGNFASGLFNRISNRG
jgi:hypothetical protein